VVRALWGPNRTGKGSGGAGSLYTRRGCLKLARAPRPAKIWQRLCGLARRRFTKLEGSAVAACEKGGSPASVPPALSFTLLTSCRPAILTQPAGRLPSFCAAALLPCLARWARGTAWLLPLVHRARPRRLLALRWPTRACLPDRPAGLRAAGAMMTATEQAGLGAASAPDHPVENFPTAPLHLPQFLSPGHPAIIVASSPGHASVPTAAGMECAQSHPRPWAGGRGMDQRPSMRTSQTLV
jgi:hypothetical protein